MAALLIAGGKFKGQVTEAQMDERLAKEVKKAKAKHPSAR